MTNSGRIKWAVTAEGKLLAVPEYAGGVEISHAVITGGRAVRAAGTADIAAGGGRFVGLQFNTHSGHFMNGASAATNKAAAEIGLKAFARYGITF